MHDEGHNDKHEDQILHRLIEKLDSDENPLLQTETSEPIEREYLELIGLLPFGLEEAEPAASTKGKILARVQVTGESQAAPQRDVGDLTLIGTRHRPGVATAGDANVDRTLIHATPSRRDAPPPATQRTQAPPTQDNNVQAFPAPQTTLKPWFYAIAAMLGLCLLGLSFMAGRLSELTRATSELQGVVQQQAEASPAEYQELLRIRDQFDMITTVARQVYPLHPATASDIAKNATGTIFVCGAHQKWYLNLQGLEPPPPQKQYRLWFLTQEGTVHGGVLEVDSESTADLNASTMPTGTHGFAVTLEDVNQDTDQPTGPFVLLGENSVPL